MEAKPFSFFSFKHYTKLVQACPTDITGRRVQNKKLQVTENPQIYTNGVLTWKESGKEDVPLNL